MRLDVLALLRTLRGAAYPDGDEHQREPDRRDNEDGEETHDHTGCRSAERSALSALFSGRFTQLSVFVGGLTNGGGG